MTTAPDGSPVDLYLLFPPAGEAERVHGAIPEGATVLDLGSGVGRIAHELIRLGHPVVAVDESREMLAHVGGAETVEAQIEGLDLRRRFPCVLLASHLVNTSDVSRRRAFLEACARHVAADGVVLIERHEPGWSPEEGVRGEMGDMTIALEDVRIDRPHVAATVRYEAAGKTWRHPFDAHLLDDDELADELCAVGLRFARVLDERGAWVEARGGYDRAMDSLYQPQGVEERWQRTWEEEGLYAADPDPTREAFVVMHPPPNISGSLTLGHALQLSLEDTLCRFHRMRGLNTLFQPGYDHAGTSTWAATGRELAKEGKTQKDLGRDGFDAYVKDWLKRYGGTIMSQFRRLGASLDYRRERFTMDPAYYRAVIRWFVHLYDKGWIYRDNRIVNWCPRDETALSDLEVEHAETNDTLSFVRYPFTDHSGHVTIATVRPATILADVAVAVHPDDPRYRDVVGKDVVVPFVERPVPVIADERVEPEFGTGALKVTPGHDPTDFEIGRDHGLPELTVIGLDGAMNADAGELAGLSQEAAGKRVLDWARERDLLEKQEPYRHPVGTCERCGTRVEPLIMLQWWVAMDDLAKPAIAAVEDGRVRFTPERFARIYLDWLRNVRPWCISRQIWWGHRIPVWYCENGHLTVAETTPDACHACGSRELHQDEDVLDTWFSSALYPFATLGWPDDTPDLEAFYPGDVLTTARDIIFLWVARMVFSGLELLGKEPFHDVFIHATILNPEGRRMSRTLGTGIDPEDAIEPYGADATRYGLLKMTSTQDARFSFGSIQEGRKLANKLWNVARLILANTTGVEPAPRPTETEERWILARIDATRAELENDVARFDFAHAVDRLYHLTFDDFCDWYAEAIKPRLYDGDDDAKATALTALERLLKLLHPVMPHVTEEIWTNLPDRRTRLIVAAWPEPDAAYAEDADALQRVQEAAEMFRRSGVRIPLEGEETRIFEAVVKPDRVKTDGNAAAEIERLQKEIARAEGMLANDRFVQNAPANVVEAEREKLERYRRELDALSG